MQQPKSYKCSEFLVGLPHFDKLAKSITSETKELAALSFVEDQYNQLGYPRKHEVYIEENGEIVFFNIEVTPSLRIEKVGTINTKNS